MVQAGELRERVTILSLVENPDGTGWDWQEGKTTWAKVEQTGKRSLFSTVGVSRPEWRVTLRHQPLTLFQAKELAAGSNEALLLAGLLAVLGRMF